VDITYRFVASGHQDVEKAFTGIEQRARSSKKATDEAMRSGRGGGGAGASAGGGSRRGLSETERLAQRVAASQERQARQEVRVAERAAIAKQRAEERAKQHVARIRDKHFADSQRQDERAGKDRVRRAERGAKEAARREAAAKKKAQAESDSSRDKSIGVLKDLAGGAFLATVGTGAALIGSAAKEAMSLQEAANRISINSRKSGEGFRSSSELRRGFERTAIATPGQTASGIADAVARFVSLTGDVDTALKSQGTFATVSSATGANVGDVAEAAASLSQQFDIKGIEDMRDALAALTFQGKEGSFELKDAAAQFQRLAASGAAFGIPKGVQGVKTLGGLTQIARSGTGSSEQAATAVENLLTNLKLKQTQLRGAGVNVFDKTGKARDVTDLIVESISKGGGGDMAKKSKGLAQIFGEQGIRAINPLIAKYSDAFQNAKGTKGKPATEAERTAAGIAALRAEIERSINAPGDWADVQEDAAQAQTDASAKIAAAWESIKAGVGDKVVPALADLVTKLAGEDGADGALDPFIEAAGLGVEALSAFTDALYDTGLIKRKQKSLAEQQADAEKELKKFDKKHGIGPLTAEDAAARGAIQDKIQKASDALLGTGPNAAPATMTPEEFAKRYVEANPQNFSDAATGQDQALSMARRIQGGRGTAGTTESNDWFMQTFGGENQAQTDLRRRFQGQVQFDSQTTVTTEDIQRSLDAAAKAAQAAAAAMQKVGTAGQPSVVTGV